MRDMEKHNRRAELYARGLSYSEIAKSERVSKRSITQWREKSGLPGRRTQRRVFEDRMQHYQNGLSDGEIGALVGVERSTIREWRVARRLPANVSKLSSTSDVLRQRREAYDRGSDDGTIAAMEGCAAIRIKKWRWRQKLPAHDEGPAKGRGISAEKEAARRFMYDAGYSDGRIARAEQIAPTSIAQWRYRRGLPAHRQRRSAQDVFREKYGKDPLQERAKKAIGGGLTADVAADAIASLCLDVVAGRVPLKDVERVARRYRNKAIAEWANKYGPRSLDAEIGEDGDLRLIDAIADEAPSSWLEEMGATVW